MKSYIFFCKNIFNINLIAEMIYWNFLNAKCRIKLLVFLKHLKTEYKYFGITFLIYPRRNIICFNVLVVYWHFLKLFSIMYSSRKWHSNFKITQCDSFIHIYITTQMLYIWNKKLWCWEELCHFKTYTWMIHTSF